jgi:syntaxin 1B/2/3
LHQRALSSADTQDSAELENLVSRTQVQNSQIRDQIKFLEADAAKTPAAERSLKSRQVSQLKNSFDTQLKEYQQEEVKYRQRYQEQIKRQYRIVNPDATDAELNEVSEAQWPEDGVFATAVSEILSSG